MKTDTYEGQTIPKGTIVFPNLTALSKDPDRYPIPEAFNPDRFQGDNNHAAVSALSKDYLERDHFHYGFGRRICPGIHVAEASMFILISRILWGFHIKPKTGCPLDIAAKTGEKSHPRPPCLPRSWSLTLSHATAILINKPKPYEVEIICRSPNHERLVRNGVSGTEMETGVLSFDDVLAVARS